MMDSVIILIAVFSALIVLTMHLKRSLSDRGAPCAGCGCQCSPRNRCEEEQGRDGVSEDIER